MVKTNKEDYIYFELVVSFDASVLQVFSKKTVILKWKSLNFLALLKKRGIKNVRKCYLDDVLFNIVE